MFNCNISMKFYDMSHFARSNGKETVQRAHCAVEEQGAYDEDVSETGRASAAALVVAVV